MKADGLNRAKEIASEKLSDLAAAVNTQRQVRALQKDIAGLVAERDRAMLEIGHKVFALYGRGKVRNQDIIPLCERIEEIGGKIETLNERIQEVLKPKPRGELEATELEDETEIDEAPVAEEAEAEEEPADAETDEAPDEPPDEEADSEETPEDEA